MQRCVIDWNVGIVFFWSPKCGSTTLARFFMVRLGVDPAEISGGVRPWLTKHGYIGDFPIGYRLCTERGFRGIAIARHPFTRLVSSYIDKFVVHRRKRISSLEDLEPFARAFYLDLATRSSRSTTSYEGFSFQEFVGYLREVGVDKQRLETLDPHWHPQAPAGSFDLGQLYDDVIQVDRQPLDLALGEIYGEEIAAQDVGRHNATTYATRRLKAGADLVDVNSLDLPWKFMPQNFYSDGVAADIDTLYRQDFEFFGYGQDPWA